VDKYSKVLNSAEIEILKRLLNHILEEKIEFSTNSTNLNQLDPILDKKNNKNENILVQLQGMIKKITEKALLLIIRDFNEVWIPKSAIHNNYNPDFKGYQTFLIDHWVLQKNDIIP
jgi:hypothetical protein